MLVEILVRRAGAETIMPTKAPSEPISAPSPGARRPRSPTLTGAVADDRRRASLRAAASNNSKTAPRRPGRRCRAARRNFRASTRDRDLRAGGEDRHARPRRRPARSRRRRRRSGSRRRCAVRSCGRFWRVSASTLGRSCASQRELPALGGLDRIARAEHQEIGDRAQRGQMLDRLMRRPVLAEADGVVRHDMDDALAHQRGQPDRRPAIIGEHQEGAGIGDDAAMQRHAVHGRGHAVLAHAVMDEAAAHSRRRVSAVIALVRVLFEPVRSAEPPIISGIAGDQALQREFRGGARGDVLRRLRRASP